MSGARNTLLFGAALAAATAAVAVDHYTSPVPQASQAAASARRAAQLARRQYTAGALSLLEVLDAERSVYAVELNAAQATADVSIRLVNVYESMGLVPPTGG